MRSKKKPGDMRHFRMLLEKRRKCWIRSEIRLVPQERRIGAQDPADGGRQLLEQLFELLARLPGVLVGW